MISCSRLYARPVFTLSALLTVANPGAAAADRPNIVFIMSDHHAAHPMGAGCELYGLHKNGTEVDVERGLSPIPMSDSELFLASIIDITERRRAEPERKDLSGRLEDLAGRLITAQEVEPTRVACELHDDVSQQLAALWIALSDLGEWMSRAGERGLNSPRYKSPTLTSCPRPWSV